MVGETKEKRKRIGEEPKKVLKDEREGWGELILKRPIKKKNVLLPSNIEVNTAMEDMEEDLEDTIPLSQRNREDRAADSERRKS